jgi:hypothetical protein
LLTCGPDPTKKEKKCCPAFPARIQPTEVKVIGCCPDWICTILRPPGRSIIDCEVAHINKNVVKSFGGGVTDFTRFFGGPGAIFRDFLHPSELDHFSIKSFGFCCKVIAILTVKCRATLILGKAETCTATV